MKKVFNARKTMNWEEQFKIMKRWFYRLRGKKDFLGDGGKEFYKDDFYLAFFNVCNNFKEWIIKEKVAKKEEIDHLVLENDELKLCREIANFTKHVTLFKTHFDPDTKVVGTMIYIVTETGSSYMTSTLKINSPKRNLETFDAFKLVEKCLNIWGNFLTDKSITIPEMPEENIFENFVKWYPTKVHSIK